MKRNKYREYELERLSYRERPTSYLVDRLRITFDEHLEYNEDKIIKFRSPQQAAEWVRWLRSKRFLRISDAEIYEEVKFQSEHQFELRFPWPIREISTDQLKEYMDALHKHTQSILKGERDVYDEISDALKLGIDDMEFKCEKCGRFVNFKYARIIKERGKLINSETKVLCRGLTGGSITRQTTKTCEAIPFRVCPDCEKKFNNEELKKATIGCLMPLLFIIALGVIRFLIVFFEHL